MKKRRFVGGLLGLVLLSLMILTVGTVPVYGGQGNAPDLQPIIRQDLQDGQDKEIKNLVNPVNPVKKSGLSGMSPKVTKEPDEATKVQVQETYGKLPLYFIQNDGQLDEKVKFYEKGSGHATFFTKDGVYLSLVRSQKSEVRSEKQVAEGTVLSGMRIEERGLRQKPPTSNLQPLTKYVESGLSQETLNSQLIKLYPIGANKDPEIIAEGLQQGKVNYFIGNDPEKWKSNIPTYQAVVYKEIYKDIDMKFYGNNRQLEYDIIVKPGADPSKVMLAYEGIEGLRVTEEGELEISLKEGEGKLIQKKPYIYQEIEGKRVEVEGAFVIRDREPSSVEASKNTDTDNGHEQRLAYIFDVASYNKFHPLIIDPTLVYSTYLGGGGTDYGRAIAVDPSGNVYVTGQTESVDFPTSASPYQSDQIGWDVFVTKFDPSGGLSYSTYLGGGGTDGGQGIAVDSSGNAYVTGETGSADFPISASPYQTNQGSTDTFVTKLNSTGSSLSYSTYLGGAGADYGSAIAIDSSGNAYVTGYTYSTDFPTLNAYMTDPGDFAADVFVTKLNPSGSSLVYSTYLGGGGDEFGDGGIAVDSGGNAYVTGWTQSIDFPTSASPYQTNQGGLDAFVSKLDSSGGLSYSTYLGGVNDDAGNDIAVDSSGNAYVTGITYSNDFPASATAYQTNGEGAFVTKFDSSGALSYSTHLHGSGTDEGWGIAVDSSGNAYVTGFTFSTDFPTLDAYMTDPGDSMADVFVTKFNSSGSSLVYSTYLGGGSFDYGRAIAVDSGGNAYVTGQTNSTNFPTLNAYMTDPGDSNQDAFVAKISFPPAELPKTGQTTSYATGDDGDLEWGKAWPSPRFTDNLDSTVTDNLTGLMWTQDANLPGTTKTWQQALDYVAGLNSSAYLGYNDWHLPNVNELESLINAERYGPALPVGSPFTNVSNIEYSRYWTSTSRASSVAGTTAWNIDLWDGSLHSGLGKSGNYLYVWPVRSNSNGVIQIPKTGQTTCYDSSGNVISCVGTGQDGDIQAGVAWPSPRFTDNGDGTVTDNLTGLIWAKDANPSLPATKMPWQQQAIDYVAGMNAGTYTNYGYTDWRLANRKEIRSLIDYNQPLPSLPSGHPFINVQNSMSSGWYWTSSTPADRTGMAWITGLSGDMNGDSSFKSGSGGWPGFIWPVRGGINEPSPNTPPTLSYSSDIGYGSGDGVDPDSGTASTTFTYKVVYTDADNDAPISVNVNIDGGAKIVGVSGISDVSASDPTLRDGDYTNGEQYSISLTNDVGSHNYYYFASDGTDTARLPSSGTLSGPTVSDLTITTTSLPDGTVGTSYSTTLSASGGTIPYTWSVTSLPPGLSLNSSTGEISGTPTSDGVYGFTADVTDANTDTYSKALSITINAAATPSITTTSLSDGTVGTAYSQTLSATGGTTPYTWSIVSGSLPVGLSLNSSTGVISGTPTLTGTSNFTAQVTDNNSNTDTQVLSITINAAPSLSITTTSLPNGTINTAYSQTLSATWGTTPYTWSITSGTLPTGLSLNSSSGVISGTPTLTGTSNLTAQVTDNNSNTDTQALSITVTTAPLLNGWNIVSAPYNTTGMTPTQVFGSWATWCWDWISTSNTDPDNSGSWAAVTAVTPGKAMFCYTSNNSTVISYSGTANPASVTVTLVPGWNIIANHTVTDMTNIGANWLIDGATTLTNAITGNSIGGAIYSWDGSTYNSSNIISNPTVGSWNGYWMLNMDSVNHTLTIK